MRCANCGGTIHVNEPCCDCGIDYKTMMNGISHNELKRLFKIIKEKENQDFTYEMSLAACELENSSMILPVMIDGDSRGIVELPGIRNMKFIAIATDMEEFDKCFEDFTPMTNSWDMFMDLLYDGVEGFVVNPLGETCFLGRNFLIPFFEGENDNL